MFIYSCNAQNNNFIIQLYDINELLHLEVAKMSLPENVTTSLCRNLTST